MVPQRTLVGLFVLLIAAKAVAAENTPPPRTVSVAGTAVTYVVPDIVNWRVSTIDLDKNLQAAKESSDAKLKAILKLREELGVKPEDVQTGYLSIEKEYERDKHGNRGEFKYFVVRRNVTIKQRDLKRFDEFLTRLVGSAEIEASFSFESSRVHELRADTRLKALRIARDKAEAMVKELGAGLGKVLTIEEYRRGEGGPRWFASNTAVIADSPSVDFSGGTFAPGSIEVQITVEATFEIE